MAVWILELLNPLRHRLPKPAPNITGCFRHRIFLFLILGHRRIRIGTDLILLPANLTLDVVKRSCFWVLFLQNATGHDHCSTYSSYSSKIHLILIKLRQADTGLWFHYMIPSLVWAAQLKRPTVKRNHSLLDHFLILLSHGSGEPAFLIGHGLWVLSRGGGASFPLGHSITGLIRSLVILHLLLDPILHVILIPPPHWLRWLGMQSSSELCLVREVAVEVADF